MQRRWPLMSLLMVEFYYKRLLKMSYSRSPISCLLAFTWQKPYNFMTLVEVYCTQYCTLTSQRCNYSDAVPESTLLFSSSCTVQVLKYQRRVSSISSHSTNLKIDAHILAARTEVRAFARVGCEHSSDALVNLLLFDSSKLLWYHCMHASVR